MKIEDIERRIALKANVNVQARISAFKKEIGEAIKRLFASRDFYFEFGECGIAEEEPIPSGYGKDSIQRRMEQCQVLNNAKRVKGWPASLWESEVEALRGELMSKMDLMQKLLMVNDTGPAEGDAVPDSPKP